MKTQQTIVIDGDTVCAMYSENSFFDVREIGVIEEVKKVSDVVYSTKHQRWEAIDRKTRRIIAHDPSRAGCVSKEHAYYESKISAGKYPWK